MNNELGVSFLFAIAKEIKRSYECPVILLTQKDYADNVYNTLVSIRSSVIQHVPIRTVLEIVNTFHFDWLQAVQDVENLQKRVKDTPRESILKSLDYTLDSIKNRNKYFEQYTNYVDKSLSPTDKELMQVELEIIQDMREIGGSALLDKQMSLANTADKVEFTVAILDEIKELLNWLDRLYDNMALQLCKLLGVPLLAKDLGKALQQVIDDVAYFLSPEARRLTVASIRNKALFSASRAICMLKDSDINKIVEKIKKLEDRIAHLKNEKPGKNPDVLALQHKAIFLEDRLESLENLKLSLSFLKNKKCLPHKGDEKEATEEEVFNIFNHLLPHKVRCRLIEKLVQLWETAIGEPETKSMLSIMRPAESKEAFRDDLGCFTVDKYGRKLYTKKGDKQVYQLDENNTLIPTNDDEHHVYFYDECGRYYLTDNRVRMYKAHKSASEYMLHRSGIMLKMRETVDGVQYQYDNLGRYYIDEDGKKIYGNKDSTEKYQPDSLGNLVMIRDQELYDLVATPVEPMATESSFYLKKTVGEALKRCVAEVVMTLPPDPIKYLADRLKKYHFDMEMKQQRNLDQQQLMTERERLKSLERKSSESDNLLVEPEESFDDKSAVDYNFIKYQSPAL